MLVGLLLPYMKFQRDEDLTRIYKNIFFYERKLTDQSMRKSVGRLLTCTLPV